MPENIVKSEITAPVPAGADGTGQQAAFHLLPTGDISRLMCGPIMINQLPGNNVDDMAQNIYLRLYAPAAGPPSADGSPSAVYPLMGKCSGAALYVSDTQFAYAGKAGPVNYKLYVTPLGNMWFYDIFLNASNGEQTLDLIYGQDVGLASPGHIQSNEAYNSQYIGHSVFDTEYGRAVCSRQNQRQDTGFPFLQQGGLRPGARGGVRAWSTDGYPFFGLSYKFTNEIEELRRDKLNSRLYQYEFAYVALQSGKLRFSDTEQFTFYGAFLPDAPVSRLLDPETIAKAHRSLEFMDLQGCRPRPAFREKIKVSRTLASLPISPEEVRSRYSVRKHEELDNGSLLSFFTETDEHVVLAEKERHTERSHGHIIITGRNQDAGENTLASTSYIYGVFQSQAVLGNTSFNQLFSNTRNGLNVMKFSGQRLMLKQDGEYRLLTMPAVYEMGFNYAKWLYLLGNGDTLTIISRVALDRPALLLEARSQRGHAYDFLLLARLAPDIAVEPEQGAVRARFREGTLAAETYPEMAYRMTLDRDFALWDDSAFAGEPALALEINGADSFVFSVFAAVDGKPDKAPPGDFAEEAGAYRQWLHGDIGGLRLSPGGGPEGLEKLNTAAMWFGHNARIHYASPHGLEQYGGAAWGTRDVCQGPLEYFITGQQFDIAAEILRKVFSRQYADDGSWPQWFMFDRYCGIQQAESHGDIIVWPLKALAHYLLATGGASFLDTLVPYTERGGGFTRKAESVFQHVLRALENIQTNFIEGTFLSRYGNGDWDDTLQPADVSMRENMASGWTAALTYQAFNELSEATAGYDAGFSRRLRLSAGGISDAFHRYIMADGVTAGFVLFQNGPEYMLHPRDKATGIHYRLLPMTRGIISGIFSQEEARRHYELILRHMCHPDGVRLMDTVCPYGGGVSRRFMRAETAANFGREIGLMYVHAHLRFVEAAAKLGMAGDAWEGLKKVNPVLIGEVVKNAARRQANCYFSSSDGAFDNRYEAEAGFEKLRAGNVPVKAGWRVYSSGSGLFLNQLICNCLGLRRRNGDIVIDPVLPQYLDGLEVSYTINGRPTRIIYHLGAAGGKGVRNFHRKRRGENADSPPTDNPPLACSSGSLTKILIDGAEVPFRTLPQPYRPGGALLPAESSGTIEVFIG